MDAPVVIPPPKPKKKDEKEKETFYLNLPQLPFTCIIVGPRHRGKTYLLKTILGKEKGMYGSYFEPENILLYSPTYDYDKTLHELKLKNVFKPPIEMRTILGDIMEQQEKFREENNMNDILLVLEDITQIRGAWEVLETLGYTGRHLKIQTLAVGHKMSSIPRGVRTQTCQWILFMPNEQSEWEWILNMFSRRTTQNIWLDALRRCWKDPHNFAMIDFEQQDFDRIYRSGFNNPLFTAEERAFMEKGGLSEEVFIRAPKSIRVESSKAIHAHRNC